MPTPDVASAKGGLDQCAVDTCTTTVDVVHGPNPILSTSETVQAAPTATVHDLGNLVDGPAQPVMDKFPSSTFGKQNRAFSASLYTSYPFIEYSVIADAIFCFPCRLFESGTNYKDIAFTGKGFKDWKKVREKLDKHVSTNTHLDCTTRWNAYKVTSHTGSVVAKLSKHHAENVAENWKYAEKMTEILLYLARQGLAFRGHDESADSTNRGNFLQLCELFGKYDVKFAERMASPLNLTSHDSQNQLLCITAQQVIRSIVDEVRSVGFYCLMADEARSFRDEQLTFCVRYALDLDVRERFVTFVDCSECRDADGITGLLLKTADKIGLCDVPIVAQAYDGASVMSGKDNGVQKKIRDIHPAAIYIHCMAHKLNLVIVASCMTTQHITSFFSNLQSLYVFFLRPGNDKSFNACRDQLGISAKTAPKLTDLSDTR